MKIFKLQVLIQMCIRDSYSAGGALYWPSNYVADTNANGYLGKLYALLKQGKPCLLYTSVHRRDAFRGEKALADRVRQKENIKIQYDSAVSKIRGERYQLA